MAALTPGSVHFSTNVFFLPYTSIHFKHFHPTTLNSPFSNCLRIITHWSLLMADGGSFPRQQTLMAKTSTVQPWLHF